MVVVVAVVGEMPEGVGKGCSIHGSLLVISGMFWAVARDTAVIAVTQPGGSLDVDVAAAFAAANAVVAATATACLGEDIEGKRDEQPETKSEAPRR